ncbi:MAG TPA: Type 1 glutamine amidotransferase-like domain-containing protein [Candidatus Saccharimonadales bacterium]|jgi:dipeptidase E|nr:Type 1 glutamine amidotransferase-like domain-containing protein [Candidatus Saccharimonadales bacterium]
MKLYLSSYRIPDLGVLVALIGKQPDKTHVALISNAKDYYAPRAKAVKVRAVVTDLEACGFKVDVIDLYDYRNPAAKLTEKLQEYDMLWVMGGNTFCLREAMRHSEFDKIIKGVVDGGVVFAGESAGACIAGTDLHGIELADDAEFAETVIWDGLGLAPHCFIPHADNAEFGAVIRQVAQSRANDPSVVMLNDNQAWVVNGTDERKITGVKPVSSAETS